MRRTGSSDYHTMLVNVMGGGCERCYSKEELRVHHRSGNGYDHTASNLELLCYACHRKHHRDLHFQEKAELVRRVAEKLEQNPSMREYYLPRLLITIAAMEKLADSQSADDG